MTTTSNSTDNSGTERSTRLPAAAAMILRERQRCQSPTPAPEVIVIDEMPLLGRDSQQVLDLLLDLVHTGRKPGLCLKPEHSQLRLQYPSLAAIEASQRGPAATRNAPQRHGRA
ncbi:hypothetical protein ACFV3E_36680 [Streptomyces sp. NPDC059718]